MQAESCGWKEKWFMGIVPTNKHDNTTNDFILKIDS